MPGFWVISKSNQMMRYIFTRTAVTVSSSRTHTKSHQGCYRIWEILDTQKNHQNFTYCTSNTSCPASCLWCGIFTSFEFGFFLNSWNLPKKYCHLIYHLSMLRDNENKYTASKYMLRDSAWGLKGDIATSSWTVPYLAGLCRKAVCNTRWTAED